jgi:hypothetical protein
MDVAQTAGAALIALMPDAVVQLTVMPLSIV